MEPRTIPTRSRQSPIGSLQFCRVVFVVCLLATAPYAANAQILERHLVASTGSAASSASFLIDFSVGDLVVNTAITSSFVLTQGYQQNQDFSTSIEIIGQGAIDLIAFPNPTRDAVTLQWSIAPDAPYAVSVFNMVGELVRSERALSTAAHSLDLTELAAGMYSVHVLVDGLAPILLRVQKVG